MVRKIVWKILECNAKLGVFMFSFSFTATILDQMFKLQFFPSLI